MTAPNGEVPHANEPSGPTGPAGPGEGPDGSASSPIGDILGMLMGRVMTLRAAVQVNQELLIQLVAEKRGVDVETLTEEVNKQEEAYKEALWDEWQEQMRQ